MNTQILSLTPLRGIAALFVVLHHYTGMLLPELGGAIANYTQLLTSSYLWVDFFFILSGFILAHVYGDQFKGRIDLSKYKKFIIARFARIYPLHIIVLAAFVAFELLSVVVFILQNGIGALFQSDIAYAPFSGSYSFSSLLANIFLLQGFYVVTNWNEPSWSISSEWFAYMIFPFIVPFLMVYKKQTAIAIYCSALVALFLLIILSYGHLNFSGWLSMIRVFLEFVMGITLYTFYRNGEYKVFLASTTAAVLAIVATVLNLHFEAPDILIIPALSLLLLSAAHNKGSISRYLNSPSLVWLGNISYSVYMTHWLIYQVTDRIWFKLTQHSFGEGRAIFESSGLLILFVGIVLLVSTMTYNKFELPLRSYVKKIMTDRLV